MQGGPANNATAGKLAQTVSLQLAPEQVKKITVAKQLGTLSLAVRSAVDQQDTADTGTMSSCDVSPEIARQNAIARQSATVVVYAGDKVKEYSVKKHDSGNTGTVSAAMGRRKLPARVQRWWVTQAIRLRNTQSSCRRNSDER